MTGASTSMTFEYAQARVQARHGDRPSASDWSRLLTSRDLAHFVESARRSPLGRWVTHVDARSDAHDIERALARELREHVDEVTGWVPHRWRPAFDFVRWLLVLPAVERLLEETSPPPWMANDPVVGPWARPEREERIRALRATELGSAIDRVLEGEVPLRQAWREHWESLLPRPSPHRGPVRDFASKVEEHIARMQEASPETEGWKLRSALEEELARQVRTRSGEPVAILSHLLRVALDLERLRGAMVRRALLPSIPMDTPWV